MTIPDSVAALVADKPSAVVRTARAMHEKGLVTSTLGNVSVRHEDGLIITPTRWPYAMLQVPDLVALTAEGLRCAGTRAPSSDWLMHQRIYEARSDVQAIVHTHSVWATAWSWSGKPLTRLSEERRYLGLGTTLVAKYAPAGTSALADQVTRALSSNPGVLLARHGVLAVAEDPRDALETCEVLEREAHIEFLLYLQTPSERGAGIDQLA